MIYRGHTGCKVLHPLSFKKGPWEEELKFVRYVCHIIVLRRPCMYVSHIYYVSGPTHA